MKEKEKMGDRGKNPFDGSRRRLSSTAHKSAKDYDRKENKKLESDYSWEEYIEGWIDNEFKDEEE